MFKNQFKFPQSKRNAITRLEDDFVIESTIGFRANKDTLNIYKQTIFYPVINALIS